MNSTLHVHRVGLVALAVLALLVLSGCRVAQREGVRRSQPTRTRSGAKTTPPRQESGAHRPTLDRVSEGLLHTYPALGSSQADFLIGIDVSKDMLDNTLLDVALGLVEDMSRSFYVPGDQITSFPWDCEMRKDLRRQVTIPSLEQASATVHQVLPQASGGVTQGRPKGSELGFAQKHLLTEAIGAQRGRPFVLLLLTNRRAPNPWGKAKHSVSSEELEELTQRFAGRTDFPLEDLGNPNAPGSKDHLLCWFVGNRAAAQSGSGAVLDRRRGLPASVVVKTGQDDEPQPPPPHRSAGSFWIGLATAVLFLGLAGVCWVLTHIEVRVEVNKKQDHLQFLSSSAELFGNEHRLQTRVWSVPLDREGPQSVLLGKARVSWGTLRINAAEGVSFSELSAEGAQVDEYRGTVKPGGSARFRISGEHGQGLVDVAVTDWRREDPKLATALAIGLVIVGLALIGLLVA